MPCTVILQPPYILCLELVCVFSAVCLELVCVYPFNFVQHCLWKLLCLGLLVCAARLLYCGIAASLHRFGVK